jgi:predicted nuclease of predicted toxin-antitoxin system
MPHSGWIILYSLRDLLRTIWLMLIWIGAQLSPAIATWLSAGFPVNARALRDVGLRDATDTEIFAEARNAGVVVMTKDSDFVTLLAKHGPPPRVIWLTCGNTSNDTLKQILQGTFTQALSLLEAGEPLIEIRAI